MTSIHDSSSSATLEVTTSYDVALLLLSVVASPFLVVGFGCFFNCKIASMIVYNRSSSSGSNLRNNLKQR